MQGCDRLVPGQVATNLTRRNPKVYDSWRNSVKIADDSTLRAVPRREYDRRPAQAVLLRHADFMPFSREFPRMRQDDLLSQLNPPQQDAVRTRSGPLLVLAGAGSGKTRVVTYRIARLIKGGTRADRILAVTFTNKAANEMQQRVAELIGKRRKVAPEISTFHALCVRILRRHIEHLGYPPRFTIYAGGQQESLARKVLREVSVPTAALKPSELIFQISHWKNRGLRPAEAAAIAENDKQHLAAMAYRRYQRELKNLAAVDFDDLLLCTEELFTKFADVRRAEAARFDHIMVDEYQDTNGCQYRIVRALAAGHRNLCVVGDDDQSIYGWRGAEVAHILRFSQDWPEAKVVRLEDNYRSTAAILELSNRLIQFNQTRHDKLLRAARPNGERPRILQFKDEVEEAREIVADIRRQIAAKRFEPGQSAILFRTNEQPRAFESELRRCQQPYVVIGGMSFFDRREVRDVLAYLRVLADPHDEPSLLRILNTPPRGIGSKSIEALIATAVTSRRPLWDCLRQVADRSATDSGQAAMRRFVHMTNDYRGRLKTQSKVQVFRDLLEHIHYRGEIARLYQTPEDRDSRWAAIEEVANELAAFEKRKGRKMSLNDFLNDLAVTGLDSKNEKDSQLKRNAVVLMTLHAAKGLEFPNVYLVGLEEGILPHHRSVKAEDLTAIEEERRLCYVGLTRAEDRLNLSLALTRRKWGKPRPTEPSRFLFEMIGQADNPHRKRRVDLGGPRPATSAHSAKSANSASTPKPTSGNRYKR